MTYEETFKPALDRAIAMLGLAVLSPLLLGIAIAVRVGDGGPAIFRQSRVGAGGTPFELTKFRTFPVGTPELTSAAGGGLEPTRVGRLLRRLSLDELPQLLNVALGEMSLVGPRPPLPSQLDVIEGRRACGADRLRPGITGLAQIKSYEAMPADHKVRWDCRYAASISARADARIILSTIGYFLRQPPVY